MYKHGSISEKLSVSFPTLTNLREKSHKISSVYIEMLLYKTQNSFQIKKKKTSKQSTKISLTTWMVFDQTFSNKIGIKCYLPQSCHGDEKWIHRKCQKSI